MCGAAAAASRGGDRNDSQTRDILPQKSFARSYKLYSNQLKGED